MRCNARRSFTNLCANDRSRWRRASSDRQRVRLIPSSIPPHHAILSASLDPTETRRSFKLPRVLDVACRVPRRNQPPVRTFTALYSVLCTLHCCAARCSPACQYLYTTHLPSRVSVCVSRSFFDAFPSCASGARSRGIKESSVRQNCSLGL